LLSRRDGHTLAAVTPELTMDATSPKRESCLLVRSPAAPGVARRFVGSALANWGVSDVFGDVPLLTSELVTNAVEHAASDVEVSVDLGSGRVRVEVRDSSEQLPMKADLATAREGGWGLHIVERLATRWGLDPYQGGKTVWCEVAVNVC
jgi:anti-sigma regulatory factor (Ser/Thr protein kinase)